MMDTRSVSYMATVFVVLVVAITLHEAMHAFTSHWLGDDTAQREGRLSLNPLKHVDPYMTLLLPLISIFLFGVPLLAAKPVPFNPNRVRHDEYGAALVALAGPFTNLVLALAAVGLFHAVGGYLGASALQALVIFIQINVGLFVFNMIPIPPLDGSRLIYALAPESIQEVMAQFERYGLMIIFALVLFVPAFGQLFANISQSILTRLL